MPFHWIALKMISAGSTADGALKRGENRGVSRAGVSPPKMHLHGGRSYLGLPIRGTATRAFTPRAAAPTPVDEKKAEKHI
jgi:hypothetical protein